MASQGESSPLNPRYIAETLLRVGVLLHVLQLCPLSVVVMNRLLSPYSFVGESSFLTTLRVHDSDFG